MNIENNIITIEDVIDNKIENNSPSHTDETVINESVTNESEINESEINESVINESEINESVINETEDTTKTNTDMDTVVSESSILDNDNISEYNYLLKFIIVGNSCVGKSNLLLRFTQNEFEPENDTTIGVEFGMKALKMDSKIFKLQIWDTAGQDAFKAITRAYYRNSIGCIIAYDVTDLESFNAIKTWHSDIMERSSPFLDRQTIAIVGNKIDKLNNNQRCVSHEEAEQLAKELNCMYFETSAKTGQNVNHIFCTIVADINQKINNGDITLKIKTDGIVDIAKYDDDESSSYCGCF